ncbi:MAG: divalent metal cation transporter [Spirosoma sp.]|nr:divalent metal cation transporter [Spirosoma sp.]
MAKSISFRSGLGSVLLWSVISAAFIGPGTVTTCTLAGSRFGLDLLWALTFSTGATILLQEAAARITLASGLSMGQVLTQTYGPRIRWLMIGLFGAVTLGCAAYEAGNILGAVSGLSLLLYAETASPAVPLLTGLVGLSCGLLLWQGSTQRLAQLLGLIVFGMGVAFAWVAVSTAPNLGHLAWSLVVPSLPPDSTVLVIGLIGTTIVPYNLFMGSGMGQASQRQSLSEMRWGLGVAVLLGGLISMAILISGTLITGEFTLAGVAKTFTDRLGSGAGALFGFGLAAAGFTSALTAPLAAAITGQSLLGWSSRAGAYRYTWLGVLGVGLVFGLLNVKPVPVIVMAQAVNGLLLPVVTVFLLVAVNNKTLLPASYRNNRWQNAALVLVVVVTLFLGLRNLYLALR